MAKKSKKRSWIVRMKCEVIKDVVLEGCTEEEANENPWDFVVDETEIEQPNWEVQDVRPNE